MKYRFTDLIEMEKSNPGLLQRAIETGMLNAAHTVIELPGDFDFSGEKSPQLIRGLGDRIAKIAQPIAGIIDSIAGTDLKNCGGCKQRQEALNKAFPS